MVANEAVNSQVAGDASVELQLTATNAVKALALREDSLPVEGCQAGTSLTLFAEVCSLHTTTVGSPVPRYCCDLECSVNPTASAGGYGG